MKPRDLKCFKQVADVIGEEFAEYELGLVIDSPACWVATASTFGRAFNWSKSPQKHDFWGFIKDGEKPYDHGYKKPDLSEITHTNPGKEVVAKTEAGDKQRSDGSTASYYELPKGATELQHLISHRNLNAQLGEIFRACYRYGLVSHSDMLRDAKKIKFYAQAEIERLEKLAVSAE